MDDTSTSPRPSPDGGYAAGETSDGCGPWMTLGCLGGPGVLLALVGGILLVTAFMSTEASVNLWVGSGLLVAIGATLTWGAVAMYHSPSREDASARHLLRQPDLGRFLDCTCLRARTSRTMPGM